MNAAADTRVADVVRHAKALVFDFDGTLVDSNLIKRRAFELCFKEFPEYRSEILEYCWSNNHLSRAAKFRYVYEKILDLPYTKEIAAKLHERFERATTHQIVQALEIPGAEKFLQAAMEAHILALLSSTPHDTLLQILEERGWRDYFETKRGAPVDKATWLQAFREKRKLHKGDVIFFGDTSEDACAAQSASCTFVAVAKNMLAPGVIHYIADFTELLAP